MTAPACRFAFVLALVFAAAAAPAGESGRAANSNRWKPLASGPSLEDWRDERQGWTVAGDAALDADPQRLAATPGAGVLVSEGEAVNLATIEEFQDVELRFEFIVPRGSNSGVKLNGLYEIQIRDTHGEKKLTGDSCGGVYPRAEQEPRYHLIDDGIPPAEDAARPAGEWQSLALEFYSPRFDADGKKTANARFEHVRLNGKEIHRAAELRWPTGYIWNKSQEVARGPVVLQGDHGPVAFRKLEVRPIAPRR
jgi:hypothetical protein